MITLSEVDVDFDRPALRRVSLHVPRGALYGLIGPGASGKSVLLKVVAGLVRPQRGTVRIGEDAIERASEEQLMRIRRDIGMAFQNNALFDFMNVADNVAFPLRRCFELREDEIGERVSRRLAEVGLARFEARLPSGLSGGQRKRVNLARATITGASVLLYDEPAAGLDPVSSQKLFDLLRAEQRERASTVIVVSSDLERLLGVTDRVGMLHAGELIFEGTTAQAWESENPYVHQFLRGELEGPL